MKRTAMPRSTKPLKRSPMKRGTKRLKVNRPTKAVLALRHGWCELHLSCAHCGAMEGGFNVILHLHHLLGGTQGRPEDVRNYLRLCRECHELLDHGSGLARCLFLKRESDQENFDLEWLAKVYRGNGRRILPEPVRPKGWSEC